jgi:hypothetical protein
MKNITNKSLVLICSLFVLSFFCVESGFTRFTIDSSQKALVALKAIQEKFVIALRYMKLSIQGYQVIMQDQKQMWLYIQDYLQNIPLEIEKIVYKIKIVEKDNQDYEELINQLFILLNKMNEGISMYSEYMSTIDAGLIQLLEKQKDALHQVEEYQEFCNQIP